MRLRRRRAPIPGRSNGPATHQLIDAAYEGLLHRPPDHEGRAHWEAELSQGLPWSQFLRQLISSEEYTRQVVAHLLGPAAGAAAADSAALITAVHQGILGRLPSGDELSTWHQRLAGGLPIEEFVRQVVMSGEFIKLTDERHGNPWSDLEGSNADVIVDLPRPDGARLRLGGPALDQSVMRALVQHHGLWEPEVTELLLGLLRPGDTVLDVGANLGYFTVHMAASVGPSGRVIAAEPVDVTAGHLRGNIALNGLGNVTVIQAAISDSAASRRVLVAEASLGSAFVAPHSEDSDAGELVRAVTLDELHHTGVIDLTGLRLIKLDIEGGEPSALRGMRGVLRTLRPVVVTEINTHALARVGETLEGLCSPLVDAGLRLAVLPTGTQSGRFGGLPHVDEPGFLALHEVDSAEHLTRLVEDLDRLSPPAAVVELVARP